MNEDKKRTRDRVKKRIRGIERREKLTKCGF